MIITKEKVIEFGAWLTGHDEETVAELLDDYNHYKERKVSVPAETRVSRGFCGYLIKNINEAHEKIRTAPELNPSNYTHEEVIKLNDDMIEAFGIINETLFLIKKNLPTEFAEYESKISG